MILHFHILRHWEKKNQIRLSGASCALNSTFIKVLSGGNLHSTRELEIKSCCIDKFYKNQTRRYTTVKRIPSNHSGLAGVGKFIMRTLKHHCSTQSLLRPGSTVNHHNLTASNYALTICYIHFSVDQHSTV